MKKKIKLFFTISALCLSLSLLIFGVFSALNIQYKTIGKLSYEIEDTFVEIETRVYSTSKKFDNAESLKAQSIAFQNSTFTELENTVKNGLVESQTTYEFEKVQLKNLDKDENYKPLDSDYKNIYSSVSQQEAPDVLQLNLDYSINKNICTYFVVTRIINKSEIPVYINVITQGEDSYVAPKNSHNYKLTGYKELQTLNDETYVVFAMSLDDVTTSIVNSEFVFPIMISKDIDLEQFLVVEAQETIYKTETQITSVTDLKPQVDKIINGTQVVASAEDDLNPASQNAIEELSSQIHIYDTETGFIVNGTFVPSAQHLTNNSTFYIVADIRNNGIKTVYTKIKTVTKSIDGMLEYISDGNLKLLAGENQKIVFAYNIKDSTMLPENLTINFVIEATETEYCYAQIEKNRGGFLSDYKSENDERKYRDKIKTYTFTNNSADIDVNKIVDIFKVGTVYNEDGTTSDLNAYFIKTGELFDVYIYAPVNTIYAPQDCNGMFSQWFWYKQGDDYIESDGYEIYWSNESLEEIRFKNFDTSKTINFYSMFTGNTNLKRIYGLNTFNTQSGQSFVGMFMGCASLEELDLSSFSFEKITDFSGVMGMLGTNDVYMTTLFGDLASPVVNASTQEEKIYETAKFLRDVLGMRGPDARSGAEFMYNTHIQKIVCPKDIKGIMISLCGDGVWKNQQDSTEITDLMLDNNKILIYSEE